MRTFASLFSGFEGAGIGAMAAGLQPAWGIELMPDIAAVANANLGQHVKVANILDCKPSDFDRVDVLHASPPCPNFSVAKAGGKETALDLALARKVAEFVTVLQPQVFTLENVMEYRKSRSWATIEDALYSAGYWLNIEIVNSADYGVPQTRRRMIVRAIRGGFVPYLPQPVNWIGWYAAIEDILHTLPESQFADWQLARLPDELKQTLMLWNMDQTARDVTVRYADQPVPTVDTSMMGGASSIPRAPLMGKNADKFGDGIAYAIEPAQTIGANEHGSKAFIVDCQNGGSVNPASERSLTIRNADEPCFTLTSSMGQKRPTRAFDGCRIVAMTPRALARFQSFPDWYELPDSKTLAAKGIGNAVPCLMYQRVIEGLIGDK